MNLIDKKEIAEKYASENIGANVQTTKEIGVDETGRCIFLTGHERGQDVDGLVIFDVVAKFGKYTAKLRG